MGRLVNAFAGIVAVIFVIIIIGAFVLVFWPKPPLEIERTNIVKRELPESCNGVLSTDNTLYPTADECMTFLYLDLYAPCYNNSSQSEAEACMDRLDSSLDQNCKTVEKILGVDYQVCIADTLKRVYQETGGS